MTEQELPPCPWYPDVLCPGECQYILEPGACIHEPLRGSYKISLGIERVSGDENDC